MKFLYGRLESTVLRNSVSLILETLFLLSARFTELLPIFFYQCSKFLPVLSALGQNFLPIVKAQSTCGGQGTPPHYIVFWWEALQLLLMRKSTYVSVLLSM